MSKERTCPDFIKGATNVYRTKKYIVKQRIDVEVDTEDDNVLISYQQDKEYEYGMSEKQNIDGKRMRTSMYARRYVE